MRHDSAVEMPIEEHADQRQQFRILCGVPAMEHLLASSLIAAGFRYTPEAATLLLVDAPQGFALRQLETLPKSGLRIIVTTRNRCPEYWEDLWDLQPDILIVSDNLQREVNTALLQVSKGEQYRVVPDVQSRLTGCERIVLQLIARGWTTERVAKYRGVSPKTVHNTMSNICEKLQMPTRHAAMLYYWGRLDLLD